MVLVFEKVSSHFSNITQQNYSVEWCATNFQYYYQLYSSDSFRKLPKNSNKYSPLANYQEFHDHSICQSCCRRLCESDRILPWWPVIEVCNSTSLEVPNCKGDFGVIDLGEIFEFEIDPPEEEEEEEVPDNDLVFNGLGAELFWLM